MSDQLATALAKRNALDLIRMKFYTSHVYRELSKFMITIMGRKEPVYLDTRILANAFVSGDGDVLQIGQFWRGIVYDDIICALETLAKMPFDPYMDYIFCEIVCYEPNRYRINWEEIKSSRLFQ